MKKLISYVITLAIILSLVIIPSATSALAETAFLDDGVFTFDSASDVYAKWGGGTPTAPTYTLSDGSINVSFAAQWTYECVLLPVKLKAGESYTAKINYNIPQNSKLWVFYTDGAPNIDKSNNIIYKVLSESDTPTSGDKETVFAFTATDDTKNILGLYIENGSTENFTAKVNSFVIKKTTTGEANLEFNDSLDMAATWKYGTGATAPAITTDNGHSAIVTTLPKSGQTRIALPVKIEAGKTYKYKVTMRSSTGTALTKVKLFVGSTLLSSIGDPDINMAILAASVKVPQNYTDYLGEFTVDASKITETQNLLSIYINNSGNDDISETYYIDSIAISEKKEITPKSQDTIEFDSLSDVTGTQTAGNGASAAPVVRHDVENGKVCVDFNNSQWAHARIGLPVKLEKDTDYLFTIKYKAPKTTTYYLFAGETGRPLYPYTGQLLSGKPALTTSNDVKELQFEYKASAGKITDLNNLLALYVESSVADVYTLEIYSISYQSQKAIADEGTVNFNSGLTYTQRGVYNKSSTAIEEIDGTKALAVTLPASSQMNIELPIKLKSSAIYKYTISYNLDATTQSGLYLYMSSAPSGTNWVNKDNYYIAKPVENGRGIETHAGFNTGTFASTAYMVNETNDTLYFYIKSAVESKLYIKSITLEILKGDFNGDCQINATDLVYMKKALLAENETGTVYDINKDNAVDILDLIKIKKNCIISPAGDSFNGYSLVFADDFNGSTLDKGWQLNTFENESQKIKVSGNNYSLSNGKLTLKSQPTDDGYYTGTEMFRKDFSFAYGYFEVRAKLATGGGNQSAFWGKGSTSVAPYYGPEIDVFETFGRNDTITSCFHSWWKNDVTVPGLNTTAAVSKNGKMNIQHIRSGITNMTGSNQKTVSGADTGFHTYGCEWTPEYIKYYVDRTLYCTVDLTKNSSEYAVLNSDNNAINLYLTHAIMQDATVAAVNDQTQNPSEFVVDYVRLYQGANSDYIAK